MMPDRHPSAVILFAKAPAVGRVKTRLAVRMAAKEATRLYEAFLRDSLAIVRAAKCDLRVLAYTPPEAEAEMKQMASKGFWFHEQAGRDLGERMVDAFKTAFEEGFRRVVILGADSPTLPVRYVNQALRALKRVDVVLGPALDGGYYLVGLAKPRPELFRGVAWSTPKVLSQTIRRIKRTGLSLHLLPPWYDVDAPDQVEFLASHLAALHAAGDRRTAQHTAKLLL